MTAIINRKEVLLKDLPTRSVTFYPSRALISRELPDVELKPGANEIVIFGLTPTTDEHSIKVDGTGSASVTDMTIDFVPNSETFAQAYPDDVDNEESESESELEDEDEIGSEEAKTCRKRLKGLRANYARELTVQSNLQSRAAFLKQWYHNISGKEAVDANLGDLLATYQQQGLDLTEKLKDCQEKIEHLDTEQAKAERQLNHLTKDDRRAKRKADIQKAKEKQQAALKKDSDKKEKQRVKNERAKYFPKLVYKVTLSLDVPTDTPGTSRRSSMSSITLAKGHGDAEADDVNAVSQRLTLQLSYITLSASWAPRYDIELLTSQKSGKIVYRAEFTNHTSETWQQAKVSLSTSQTSFRGLDDEVPWMHAWRIGLSKGFGASPGALTSLEEQKSKQSQGVNHTSATHRPRAELFGIEAGTTHITLRSHGADRRRKSAAPPPAPSGAHGMVASARRGGWGVTASRGSVQQGESGFGEQGPLGGDHLIVGGALFGNTTTASAPQPGASLFGGGGGGSRAPAGNNLFGQPANTAVAPASYAPAAVQSAATYGSHAVRSHVAMHDEEEEDEDGQAYEIDAGPRLDFEEATWEDHGLTTTYDIPGTRTIEPSSLTRRHKIASLPFNNLILPSIAVPKLRPAAFLRARFRNPSSSITLLKGTAGLTLDGTFLGNTTLPRVSPGELITLPLGVDPALHITYAKPSVKHSTQGIFNKDSAQVFTRSIIITNTKATTAELLVLDQVPISEDEKLRVELIEPRGLYREGDTVSTGTNASESSKKEGKGKWGNAKALLKNNGQIAFNVTLEKGSACKLPVEYEAKAPASESIVSK